MNNKINRVDQLPDWFDIDHYDQWQGKSPKEVVSAIADHMFLRHYFYVLCCSGRFRPADSTIEQARRDLAVLARDPYNREKTVIAPVYKAQSGQYVMEDCRQEEQRELDAAVERKAADLLGGHEALASSHPVGMVSLYDAVEWMENHVELIAEVDHASRTLAEKNGWDPDRVRKAMYRRVPLINEGGDSFLVVSGMPSIDAQVHAVRQHLLMHHSSGIIAHGGTYAEIRKLVDYRVAAYADLSIWSFLEGTTITKKCLARALFPDGRFGENDMQPTKAVGQFFRNLETGKMEQLMAKTAEVENMRF